MIGSLSEFSSRRFLFGMGIVTLLLAGIATAQEFEGQIWLCDFGGRVDLA